MSNWFECKINYEKMTENGMPKKVKEPYLLEAMSFTEAEARIIEYIRDFISGEFAVADIRRVRFYEIFLNDEGDKYYKVKIMLITPDEKTGTEKKTAVQILAKSSTVVDAVNVVNTNMKGTLADYEIVSVSETALMDVLPFVLKVKTVSGKTEE